MAKFAEGTTVSPERSQMEITETLRKYGATSFAFGWENNRAMIAFVAHERKIRFLLDLPLPDDKEFRRTPTGRERKDSSAAYEAEIRRRWRALALAIKAKLEAVATGIASFEDEFLAYTVLPDNTTVSEQVQAQITEAWRTGQVPPLLQIGQ